MAGKIYMTTTAFMLASMIPEQQVVVLINNRTGWLENRIDWWSRKIEARLAKRYKVPFDPSPTGPAPAIVLMWLTDLVQRDAYIALGTQSFSEADQKLIESSATQAEADLLEAANEETGLFDIPLRDDQPGSAIIEEAPLMSTDTSPYSWIDRQGPDGRRP